MESGSNYLRDPYPLNSANIFSKLLFMWFRKICSKSINHNFNINDLHECPSADRSGHLTDIFESNWNYEVIKAVNKSKTPSLLRIIRKTFFWRFAIYSIMFFVKMVILRPLLPVLLGNFLQLFSKEPNSRKEHEQKERLLYIFGGSMVFVNTLSIFMNAHMEHILPRIGIYGKLLTKLRLQVAEKTNQRVENVSETFSAITLIKMYAWEKPFTAFINKIRIQEIQVIESALKLTGVVLCCWNFIARIILFITVTVYALSGNKITPSNVFSVYLIFSILEESLTVMFPMAVNHAAETSASIKRIQEFLQLEEKEFLSIPNKTSGKVILQNASFSWSAESPPFLENINIEIQPGSLCVILGPVRVGKSTLLQILLEELSCDQGTLSIGGEISYVSQNPWIFSATARRNILFGQDYDENRFKKVVEASSLTRDFKNLPQEDATLVGKKGICLSDCQKTRINIARAVYRNSDIYIFDDPFSSVNQHLAKELFEQCILNYLQGKTRILVTHQLCYLEKADQIIVLNNGRVEAQGSFRDLSIKFADFARLLTQAEDQPNCILDKNQESEKSRKMFPSLNELVTDYDTVLQADIDEEGSEVPKTKSSTFWIYIKTSQKPYILLLLVLLLVGTQALANFADLWLTFWTDHIVFKHPTHHNVSISDNGFHFIMEKVIYFYDALSVLEIIYIYAVILLFLIIITIGSYVLFYDIVVSICNNMHSNMLESLLCAPARFFHTHSNEKILKRFSRDIGVIDQILPQILQITVMVVLIIIGTLIVILIANPYMIIAVAVLLFIYKILGRWYITVAQNMKHLESATKSPVYSFINATWDGIATIRATQMDSSLKKEFDNLQDTHTSAWNNYIVSIAAFALWIDLLSTFLLFFVIFSYIILTQSKVINGSFAGLAISQTVTLTGILQFGISNIAHVLSQLISVERILDYSYLEKEDFTALTRKEMPVSWPEQGKIEFRKVYLRYTSTDALVLKNLNFTIHPREKIGIVGRPGAGKSSLISMLFHLIPIEGNIIIDDVHIQNISLHELRSNITIVPQDPILFSATIRHNLDPLEIYTDNEIWRALEDVHLKDSIPSLNFFIDEGGSNFRVYQRQLICLARAILRRSKILVLEESTTGINYITDQLIQNTIRSKFENCTVLTVTHRLNTTMDFDKILVLDSGEIVEFDSPSKLLQNKNGYFYKMVSDSNLLDVQSD